MELFRVSNRCLLLAIALTSSSAFSQDWARFRGPNGSGISPEDASTPEVWNDEVNLKWKRELPGQGSSCAIVVGNRIFVTSWSGYGLDRDDPGDQENLRRHLTCLDRETGDIYWDKAVEPYLPEDEYGGMFAEHGYASHTPVSDGETVFVHFGKTGALAFDFEGNELWQQSVGTESGARNWGSASSPILYEDLLIVAATAESEALVALNKATGEEVWRQEAAGFNSVWGTPTLAKVDDDRTDLVIAVPGEIWGLNPATGNLRWYCQGYLRTHFAQVRSLPRVLFMPLSRAREVVVESPCEQVGLETSPIPTLSGRDNNRDGLSHLWFMRGDSIRFHAVCSIALMPARRRIVSRTIEQVAPFTKLEARRNST